MAGLAMAAIACAQEQRPAIEEHPVDIRAIALDVPEGEQSLDGSRLRWVAGFDLEGSHERFGGFSGMLIDGDSLLAVSDRGWWWRGILQFQDDGTLTGVDAGTLWPIVDLAGGAVIGRHRLDAEHLPHLQPSLIHL